MPGSRWTAAVLLCTGAWLAGCTDDVPQGGAEPVATDVTAAASHDERSSADVIRAVPTQPLYDEGDIDSGLRPWVDRASADLAALLGADPQAITTHAAVLVTWPDTSLGCPAADMRYTPVLTDGAIIELTHAGKTYRYHAGGSREPFLCQQPITAPPATTGPR